MIEHDVEMTVVLRAERRGWLVRKVQWIGRRNAMDRLFVKNGRIVFVEFKRPGEGARETQSKEIGRFRAAGAEVHVIDNIETGDALFP